MFYLWRGAHPGGAATREAWLFSWRVPGPVKKNARLGKTRYYCFSSELLDVRTGQSLSDDFLVRTSFLADRNKTDPKSIKDLKPGVYRLGQYHISVTDQGDISWQTFRGMNRVLRGPCLIESGMLFLAPQEEEEGGQKKRGFHQAIRAVSRCGMGP